LYRVLVELDKVNFLVSPIGPSEQAVQQLAADYEVLNLALTAPYVPGLGYNTSYTINYLQRADLVLSTCIKQIYNYDKRTPFKTAYIIGNELTYFYTLLQLPTLYEYNITIVGQECYPITTTDFTQLVEKWKAINPDIIIGGGQDDYTQIAQAIRLANWNPIILLIAGGSTSSTPAMDYAFTYGVWTESLPYTDSYFGTTEQYCEQTNSFLAAANLSVSSGASAGDVIAYVSVYLAIRDTQSLDSTVVRNRILTANYSTIYGLLTFDDTNSFAEAPLCLQYTNGTYTIIGPNDVKQTEPVFGVMPILPKDCYPQTYDRTSFLLSVTLGTILPGLFIIIIVIIIVILAIRKFDLILLPKQNADTIDF